MFPFRSEESPFFSRPGFDSSLSYFKQFSSSGGGGGSTTQSWRLKDYMLQNYNNLINSDVICCWK